MLLNESYSDIVCASSEGRGAAAEVDAYLSEGSSRLPVAGGFMRRVFIPPTNKITNGTTSTHVEVTA